MERRRTNIRFPIEKKLATLQWNLKLLNTSITTTHTPIQTIKSMVKGNVILPIVEKLENR
jgi:prefoldin subunit 5